MDEISYELDDRDVYEVPPKSGDTKIENGVGYTYYGGVWIQDDEEGEDW